jgi:hypothetical protein
VQGRRQRSRAAHSIPHAFPSLFTQLPQLYGEDAPAPAPPPPPPAAAEAKAEQPAAAAAAAPKEEEEDVFGVYEGGGDDEGAGGGEGSPPPLRPDGDEGDGGSPPPLAATAAAADAAAAPAESDDDDFNVVLDEPAGGLGFGGPAAGQDGQQQVRFSGGRACWRDKSTRPSSSRARLSFPSRHHLPAHPISPKGRRGRRRR